MECLVYTEPQKACPRFDYSVRQLESLIKRICITLNDQGIPFKFEHPDFSNIEIRVESSCASKRSLVLKNILQKPTIEKVTEIVHEGQLDEKVPILLLTYVESEPENLRDYNCANVVLVSESSSLVDVIKEKAQEEKLNLLSITSTDDLKRNISNLLERIVFRSISDLVSIVRDFLEVSLDNRNVDDCLKESIHCLVKSWLSKKSVLEFIEYEFYKEHEQHGLIPTINDTPLEQDTKDNLEELHEKLPYLEFACSKGIEKTEGKFLWHYLLFNMSKATAQCITHKVTEFSNGIPKRIRQFFKLSSNEEEYDRLLKECYEVLSSCFETEHHDSYNYQKLQDAVRQNKLQVRCKLRDLANKQPQIQAVATQLQMLKSKTHILRGFQGEIAGMYNRSDVPQHERPVSPIIKRKLNQKVTQGLFENFEHIKGCGYRYGRLTIFHDLEDGNETAADIMNSHIKRVLTNYGITEYDVTPAAKFVKHYKKVGAKIKLDNNRCGTLGGFANMSQSPPRKPILCALLSKHVVNGSEEVYLVDNGDSVRIGSMVQAQQVEIDAENSLIDVAAAKIHENYQCDCETRFKKSSGECRRGVLYTCTPDDTFLSGLPVHIYGAATGPGRGVISIPEYVVNDETCSGKADFMIIEDIREEQTFQTRFSKEGDSGSIVCADDRDDEFVHVIAMLVGCSNYEDIKDQTKPGKYFCFRMTSALNKLEQETGFAFSLCS